MKLNRTLLAFAAAVALIGPAQAITFTGNTTGGPTWNRPYFDFSDLSPAGTGVRYEVTPFTVTASGTYTFQNTAISPANWDNFTFVYRTAFSPSMQLVNGVIGNDDNSSIGLSGFATALTAGTNYFYVVTGFSPPAFGSYSASITGPGNVLIGAVPEPASYALMALGLASVAALVRRSR